MIPPMQQWPWGPQFKLHNAAKDGSTERTIALLSTRSINIDQGSPLGWTPLMFAAKEGHSRVAKILLSRGASVSIAADCGGTALHLSALNGHLAVTVDLIKAGADLDAKDYQGTTSLHLAAQSGHSAVMAALVEAGANVDSRLKNGRTPLLVAAYNGRLDAVKVLLFAKANPLLAMTSTSEGTGIPLEATVYGGHSEVVCELIQQVGIEGCGGESGGVDALVTAAERQHVDIMGMLVDAGVVDTGEALLSAAGSGREASVKFLLQQRRLEGSPTDLVGYVNSSDAFGVTPLFCSIDVFTANDGVPHLISPKVVRMIIDAGADASSAVRVTHTPGGGVLFNDTPLAFTNDCLRTKKVDGKDATEEQMNRLEAVRRLLLRVEAVHAVSWLWLRDPLLVDCAAEVSSRTARRTAGRGTQLRLMLPILRRRSRGVLLAPLFRYSSYP